MLGMLIRKPKRKRCTGCKKTKPLSSFYFLNKERGWLRSKCTCCVDRQNAAWRAKNLKRVRAAAREYQQFRYYDQLPASRAVSRANAIRGTLELKIECFEKLGGACQHCGFDKDQRALQIDHVHGGGHKERTQLKSANALYRKVLADKSDRYQLLCANCNVIKRHVNKEWGPRQRKR